MFTRNTSLKGSQIYHRRPFSTYEELVVNQAIVNNPKCEYIRFTRDMYDSAKARMRMLREDIERTFILILHCIKQLSVLPFVYIIYDLTKCIQDEISCNILFENDMILINESKIGVNLTITLKWRDTLKPQSSRMSKSASKSLFDITYLMSKQQVQQVEVDVGRFDQQLAAWSRLKQVRAG